MPRPERLLNDGSGPVGRLAADLRRLRESAGRPGYRELARSAHFSASTLAEAAGGRRLPTLPVTLAYVRACGGDPVAWEARWRVVEAELVADRPPEPGPGAPDGSQPAPYRGLAAYQPEDADWFFGRERLVAGIVERLSARRFLAVFGPSGAGKSSLLRAGLVPAALGGALGNGTGSPVVVLTPGRHPLGELAVQLARRVGISAGAILDDLHRDPARVRLAISQALAEGPPEAELLLVVDQFEEVFALCPDEERACFVSALVAAARSPDSRARVVLGVRADYYARCAEHPDLVEAMADGQVLVGPMTAVQVRDAVTKPADRAGLMIDGALVSTVVAAVAGRAGALPLVSHALLESWRRRRGRAVTLAGFEAAGGLEGAVSQTAEDVYAGLGDDQRRQCREVLLRMIDIELDGVVGGRRVALSELDGEDPDVATVLDRLAATRLLTLDDGTAGLAHEVLITAWPRLRAWVDEDREGLRLHRQLTQSAAIWQSLDRDPGALYRGVRLLDAVQWSSRHPTRLSPPERQFLASSTAASRREGLLRRRRLRLSLAGLVSALVTISVLAGVALAHADRARTERDLAISRQLIANARSQLQVDPELALVLARQAYARNPAEAETILRQATLDSRQVATFVTPHESALYGVAFDPAGGRLAAVGKQVRIWDVTTRDERVFDSGLESPAVPSAASCRREKRDVAYGPGGRHLAAIRSDGGVVVWDVSRPDAPSLLDDRGAPACAVAFSPDGRRVASAGEDGTVRIHAIDGGGRPTVLRGHRGPIRAVAFSPDGRRVASAGEDHRVLAQPADGRGRPALLTTTREAATAVAFHPTGQRVAAGAMDGTAHDISTSPQYGVSTVFALGGHVSSVAYSPDGGRLVAAQSDGLIQLWNRDGQGSPLILRGHQAAISTVSFSPDGQRLASAGLDGTVRLWDTGGRTRPLTLWDSSGRRVWAAAVSPDGRYVVGGGSDGTIRIWDLAGPGGLRVLRGHRGRVHGLSLSADGRRLASIGDDATIRIWDLGAAAPPIVLRIRVPGDPTAMPMALSPDGRRLAIAGSDGVYLWPVTGEPTPRQVMGFSGSTWSVAFSPDGRRVASASDDGVVRIADTDGDQTPTSVHRHTAAAYSVAFSPDGSRVASAGQDAAVRLSTIDGSGTSTVLASQIGGSHSVAFSPDGRLIATIGQDTIRIWNSGGSTEPTIFAGPLPFDSVAFSPDGRWLITTNHDTAIRIWQCEVCGPIDEVLALASQRATRQLTPDERRLFLRDTRS